MGRNSDLDGNYDAMMARIRAGRDGAGFYQGQPTSETVGAPINPGFAEGGSVPDPQGLGDLGVALGVVKQVEQFRRQKHGLLGTTQDPPAYAEGGLVLQNRGGMRGPGRLKPDQPRSYAEGGAVEEEEDYSSDPFAQLAQDEPEGGFRGAGASADIEGGPDPARIMQYLQGADAAPTEAIQAAEAKVDPEGTQDEAARKVLAVAAAAEEGGPEAAAAISAGYRQRYDAFRGAAAGALAHGDLAKAAQAASRAYPNVLDGVDVKFTPQGDGITATVTPPGGQPQSVPLSKAQFNEFLKGNAGQYDHLMELGVDKTLKDLSRSGGVVPTEPGPADTRRTQWVDKDGIQRGGNPADHPEGSRTGTPVEPRPAPDRSSIEARADRLFPAVSQGQRKRQWIEDQYAAATQTETERMKITDAGDAKRAAAESARMGREHAAETGVLREQARQQGQLLTQQEKSQTYERVQMARNGVRSEGDRLKYLAALQKIAGDTQNTQLRNAASLLRAEIQNVALGKPLSKQAQKAADTIEQFTPQAIQSGQAPAAPQAPGQTAPAPAQNAGGQRIPGKNPGEWYVQRPDGKFYLEKK